MLISIVLLNTRSMATTAIVNTDTLKLREQSSTESNILGLLNLGEKIEIIEEDGDWYKVKVNNKDGYVHKDYIKIEETEIEEQEDEQTATFIEENQNIVNEETNDAEENKKTNKVEYEPKEATLSKDTNCYILPLINSNILLNMKKNSNITIMNEVNGWLYIETEEIAGWIIASSIDFANLEQDNSEQTVIETNNDNAQLEETSQPQVTPLEEKNMYVNTSSIYMRKGPGTDYEVVDSLILNSGVIITGEVEDWYQVKVSGKTGYIAKRLLSNTKTEDTTSRGAEERAETTETQESQSIEQNTTSATSKGQEIVNYAKQYLGCKYVYGGSGPSTFDCSGFTMYVYKHFGVSLSHSATAQSKVGTYVTKENLMPGDLVFFKDYQTMDGIGHCGIYIGDGNFIHASSGTGYCVKISTLLSGSYNTRYSTARRII